MLSEDEIERIEETPGEIIGASLKEDIGFLIRKEGEKGVKRVEEELERIGHPLQLKKIKTFHWYPFYFTFFIHAINKDLFQWNDEDFRENGRLSAKLSVVLKIGIKYFISIERTLKHVNKAWRMYCTVGEVTSDYHQDEHLIIITFTGFTGHPTFCRSLEGFAWQVFAYHLPTDNLVVKEIECPFSGGSAHRFELKW